MHAYMFNVDCTNALGHPQCKRQIADLKAATSARDPNFCYMHSTTFPTHDT